MEILEQTSTKLVCQIKQTIGIVAFVFVLFWGCGFGGIPLFLIFNVFAMSGTETLTCNRTEPNQVNCELNRATYMGLRKEKPVSISKVRGAKARVETNGQVILLTQQSQVSLSNYNPDDATRINEFVKHPNSTSLIAKYDRRASDLVGIAFFSIFVGIALAVIGWSLYSFNIVETFTFNKTSGQLTKKRQSLLGTQIKEYLLQDITNVRFEEKTDSEGDKWYKVSLVLTTGKSIALTSSNSFGSKERKQELAERIAQFLNL